MFPTWLYMKLYYHRMHENIIDFNTEFKRLFNNFMHFMVQPDQKIQNVGMDDF